VTQGAYYNMNGVFVDTHYTDSNVAEVRTPTDESERQVE